MKIEDDFLEQKDFDELQNFIMGPGQSWSYGATINRDDDVTDINKFMFYHLFMHDATPCSPNYNNLLPIFEIIKPISLFRVKANLLTRTSEIIEHTLHIDFECNEFQQDRWMTSIFYMNTNDGYTKFEDGTKIESVANRMVTFLSNMKHTGTSCTNEKVRVLINFNYFK